MKTPTELRDLANAHEFSNTTVNGHISDRARNIVEALRAYAALLESQEKGAAVERLNKEYEMTDRSAWTVDDYRKFADRLAAALASEGKEG